MLSYSPTAAFRSTAQPSATRPALISAPGSGRRFWTKGAALEIWAANLRRRRRRSAHAIQLHPFAAPPRPSYTLTSDRAARIDSPHAVPLPPSPTSAPSPPHPSGSFALRCLLFRLPVRLLLAGARSPHDCTRTSRAVSPPPINRNVRESGARTIIQRGQTGTYFLAPLYPVPATIAAPAPTPCCRFKFSPPRTLARSSSSRFRSIPIAAPSPFLLSIPAPSNYRLSSLSTSRHPRLLSSRNPTTAQPPLRFLQPLWTGTFRLSSLTLASLPNPIPHSAATRSRSPTPCHSSPATRHTPFNENHGWLSPTMPSSHFSIHTTPRKPPPLLSHFHVTKRPRALSAVSPDMHTEQMLYQATLQHMQSFIENLEPRSLQAVYQLAAHRLRVWLATTLPDANSLDADNTAAAHNAAHQLALLALSQTYRAPSPDARAFSHIEAQSPTDSIGYGNGQLATIPCPSSTEPLSSNPLPPATYSGPTASRAHVNSQHSLLKRHKLAIRDTGGTPDIALLWNSIPNQNVDRSHAVLFSDHLGEVYDNPLPARNSIPLPPRAPEDDTAICVLCGSAHNTSQNSEPTHTISVYAPQASSILCASCSSQGPAAPSAYR
ncbi:hypothetical protein C8Q76DRAFT_790399 [Earliella scabrosa]|nr:hypothetical protein C8Q76DRAFT_790399 [Earliella scabrosa]